MPEADNEPYEEPLSSFVESSYLESEAGTSNQGLYAINSSKILTLEKFIFMALSKCDVRSSTAFDFVTDLMILSM